MDIDLLTQVSYLSVLPNQIISANTNSAALQIGGALSATGNNTVGALSGTAGFKGRLALVISSGSAVNTPAFTGYLVTGGTNNIAAMTNVVLSTYNTSTNALASNPLNSNVATFSANATNQIQVFGFDSRAVSNYVALITSISGVNATLETSAIIIGTKAYEPS